MQENNHWLSAHLYYAEAQDVFLMNSVKPFVCNLAETGHTEQYFFIRYLEKGPHIRLRIKADIISIFSVIKPMLEDHFNSYFKKFPSHRRKIAIQKFAKKNNWFPDNSVQFIEYSPEVERYGGPEGILVAEKYFHLSSKTVLNAMTNSDNWTYERAIGTAIQLHTAFVYTLGMDVKQAYLFFLRLYKATLPFAGRFIHKSYDKPINNEQLQTATKILANSYEKNKMILSNYIGTLWDAFHKNLIFHEDWFNDWLYNCAIICKQVKYLNNNGRLNYPEWWFKLNPDIDAEDPTQRLILILGSYIHMTNNRLGLLNYDESYISFILMTCFEERTVNDRVNNIPFS
jgi:hypothetical protein